MRKIPRITAAVLCLFLCMTLCGCAPFTRDADSLLSAPKLTGELQPVQEALEKAVGGKYSLKFPASGETKAAITLVDLNGDQKNEAVAFYSTSEDSTVMMHVAVLDSSSGAWMRTAESKIVAGGVERVHFTDMDSDGVKEIVVGWNVYGDVNKTVSVYEYNGSSLINIIEEPYTSFLLCDLDNGFSSDLLTVYLDLSGGAAAANYFDVTGRGVAQLGACELDGNVTAYYDPVLVKMQNGSYCVYLDCVKGAGLVTEVLYVEEGKLVAPFYDPVAKETAATYRPALVPCIDFDGDKILEIPVMTALPTDVNFSASAAYLTVWHSLEGNKLLPKAYTLMNYSDGYSITLTKELAEATTAVRNLKNRERIIYEYDYAKNEFKDELFRIRVVSKTAFDSGIYSNGYIVLDSNEVQVWLAAVSPESKKFGIDEKKLGEMFKIISGE